MKKYTKVSLMLAGLLAGAGVILVIVGFAMGASLSEMNSWGSNPGNRIIQWLHWGVDDSSEDMDEVGESQEYIYTGEEFEEIKNLDIEIKAGSLRLVESGEQQIRLVVKHQDGKVKCKVEDETLVIKDESGSDVWFGIDFGSWDDYGVDVELYVPAGWQCDELDIEVNAGEIENAGVEICAGEAELNVDAGTLQMDKLVVSEHLKVEVGAGELQIADVDAAAMELDCGMGEMSITGNISGDVVAKCGMGELNLDIEGDLEAFDYDMKCGLGDIRIGNESYTSLGEKKSFENHAEKKMELDCGMGEINVY